MTICFNVYYIVYYVYFVEYIREKDGIGRAKNMRSTETAVNIRIRVDTVILDNL